MESDAIFEEMATKMLTTMVTVEKLKRDAEKAFNERDYQVSVDKLKEAAAIVQEQPGTAARIELASILLPLYTKLWAIPVSAKHSINASSVYAPSPWKNLPRLSLAAMKSIASWSR